MFLSFANKPPPLAPPELISPTSSHSALLGEISVHKRHLIFKNDRGQGTPMALGLFNLPRRRRRSKPVLILCSIPVEVLSQLNCVDAHRFISRSKTLPACEIAKEGLARLKIISSPRSFPWLQDEETMPRLDVERLFLHQPGWAGF